MDEIVFSAVPPDSHVARSAMAQYFDELERRAVGVIGTEQALEDAATAFRPPRGLFIIGSASDQPVACGAVHYLNETTGEIKRMWVSAHTRGGGVGKRLLGRLEREIVVSGRSRAVLDTSASLTEAVAMYRSCGYVPIERYNDNPHAELWFSKSLTSH